MNSSKTLFNFIVCSDSPASMTFRYLLYSFSADFNINTMSEVEFSKDTVFSSYYQGFVFYSNSDKNISILDGNFQMVKYKSCYPEKISCINMVDNLVFTGSINGKVFLTFLNDCENSFEILDLRYPIKKICLSKDSTTIFVASDNSIFKIELTPPFNSLRSKEIFQADTEIIDFQLGFTYFTIHGHSGLMWVLLDGGNICAIDVKSSNILCTIPTFNFINESLTQFAIDKIGNVLFAGSKSKFLSINLNDNFSKDNSIIKVLDLKMTSLINFIYIESNIYLLQFSENILRIFLYPSMELYKIFPLEILQSWCIISSCISINHGHSSHRPCEKSSDTFWFKDIKNIHENIKPTTKEMYELSLLNDKLCDLLNKRQGE